MNKIEKAIDDIKLFIRDKERELSIRKAELAILWNQLDNLEAINENDSISNETNKNERDN